MKKRMILVFVLLILLTAFGFTCDAQEDMKTIFVGEERVRISFPRNCYISQKEVDGEDPYLVEQGAMKEHVEAYYAQNQIFAHCVDPDGQYEIVCSQKSSDTYQYLEELCMLADSEVLSLAESIGNAYRDYGYRVQGIGNYSSQGEKFAVVLFETQGEEGTVRCKQYVTVRRKKTYYFTLRCFSKEAFDASTSIMESVVSSILFYRLGPDNSVTYVNDTYGISYLVPQEWTMADTGTSNPNLQAQYFHNSKLGETLQFFTYDIWGNMDMLRQLTNTRSKLDTQMGGESIQDNSSFLKPFLKNMDTVKQEAYGDANLIFEEEAVLVNNSDIQGNYYQKNYCMLKQGVLYLFQYGYYEGNNLHESEITDWLSSIALSDAQILEQDDEIYLNMARVMKRCIIGVAVVLGILTAFTGIYIYIHFNFRKLDKK